MTEGVQSKKTVYLAGPMSGLPAFNAPAFNAAAADLRQRGYRVINPVDLDLEVGFDPSTDSPEDFDLPAAVRRDVDALIGCDAIAMLPGHETSKGATAERHVAIWLGLPVLSYPSMVPLDEVETALDDFVSVPPKEVKRFKLTPMQIEPKSFGDGTNQPAPYCWQNTAIQPEQVQQLTEDGPGGDCIVPDLSPGEWTEALNAASEYSERTPVKVEPAELKAQIAYGWSRNWDSAIDGGDDSGCVPTGHEKLTEPEPTETLATDEPEDILLEAHRITRGDRNISYGPPDADFMRTAGLLTALFADKLKDGQKFESWEIAQLMICLKLSRLRHAVKRDSIVDIAGYARCMDVCYTQADAYGK